jgi:hypothetical protein
MVFLSFWSPWNKLYNHCFLSFSLVLELLYTMSKPTIRPVHCSSLWSLEGKLFGLPILASSWTQDLGSFRQCWESGDWRCGGILQDTVGRVLSQTRRHFTPQTRKLSVRSHIHIHISVSSGNGAGIWNRYRTRGYRFHIQFHLFRKD